MLRRSWETKKNIIKELNNRLNENSIISEAKGYKYSKNWGDLDPINNKIDDFFRYNTSEEFVNSFSKKILDIYYNIMKSSCGFGTTTTKFMKNFEKIDSLEELKELNGAIEEKPICNGSYKSLEDVLNGEFTGGALGFGREDIGYLSEMSKHLVEKGIGSIKYITLVNPGQTDPYGVKEGSIEIIIGSKEKPETEEKEESETEEKEESRKEEPKKKKSFIGVSDVKTLEDIVTKGKIIKKGNSGDIVNLVQQSLLDLKYDIGGTEPDGKFGPKTKAAVMKFQKDNRLTDIDGIVGPKTAQKMKDVLFNKSKEVKNIESDKEDYATDTSTTPTDQEIKLGESEISKPILEMMKRMNILK